jgi:hypothetical protein
MKKISALFMSGLIALCFSVSTAAQSSQQDLDQAELMKQFIGTWKVELNEDREELFKITPYGKGYEIFINRKAKGESLATFKGIACFTAENRKVNWFILDPKTGIPSRYLGEFVTEDKLVMEQYNYDHSRIFSKWEVNFLTQNKFKAIVKRRGEEGTWDNPKVGEHIYTRVKK